MSGSVFSLVRTQQLLFDNCLLALRAFLCRVWKGSTWSPPLSNMHHKWSREYTIPSFPADFGQVDSLLFPSQREVCVSIANINQCINFPINRLQSFQVPSLFHFWPPEQITSHACYSFNLFCVFLMS